MCKTHRKDCLKKVYLPPPPERTELFARKVAVKLSQVQQDDIWEREETINELSKFIKTVISIQLKHKNKHFKPEKHHDQN